MNQSDSSGSVSQSADLRTRIAAALTRDSFGLTTQSAALRQADAVIRELDDLGIIHLSKVVGCQTGPVGHEGECR